MFSNQCPNIPPPVYTLSQVETISPTYNALYNEINIQDAILNLDSSNNLSAIDNLFNIYQCASSIDSDNPPPITRSKSSDCDYKNLKIPNRRKRSVSQLLQVHTEANIEEFLKKNSPNSQNNSPLVSCEEL